MVKLKKKVKKVSIQDLKKKAEITNLKKIKIKKITETTNQKTIQKKQTKKIKQTLKPLQKMWINIKKQILTKKKQ